MTEEERIFNRCEQLYPKLRHGRCCIPCLVAWRVRESTEVHHIYSRRHLTTRFYLLNLMPVCAECHAKIHAGKLTEPISEQQREHLQNLANKDIKGLCIARGITKAEYFREQYKIIKEQLL